jgi:phosphatidate cytidylyltransferase
MNPKTRNLFVRTVSGIVYITLMILAVLTPWVAVPLALFFTMVGMYEYYRLCNKPELRQNLAFWLIAALCIFECFLNMEILTYESIPITPWTVKACMAGLCIFAPELFNKSDQAMSNVGLGFLGQIWVVIPLCVLFLLWAPQQPVQLLAFFILIWMSDTAAYVFGSLFGKHKLAPNISPGKTWEGFLSSCVFTIGLAVGLSYIPYFQQAGLELWQWILLSLIIQVLGLMGDLIESLFKRKAGVKDSGKIIPGHGGLLDRVDSILFATIPAYLFCLMCGA